MADLIISQPMTFTVDVKNGLVERPQRESLMRGDRMANRIIAELVCGSEPFDITGVTVKGKFCRPPSGDEIDLAGEAKGNVAEVQLTDQCYTSGGHYEARVILVLGGVERTVLFISGDVLKSGSGNAASDEETGGSGGSTGSGLPAGGTAGQVLVKVSSAQGDAIWKNLTAADVGALGKNETAVNATQLNGKNADQYMLKTDTAADSAKLDGKSANEYAKQETVDRLSASKAEKAGWSANKFIGTDESGTMVAKDAPNAEGNVIRVGAGCKFTSINDAIDYAKTFCTETNRVLIQIMPGTYEEEIVLNPNPGIDFEGSGESNTTLRYPSAYPNAPVFTCGTGTFRNMTIYSPCVNEETPSYGVHVEYQNAPEAAGQVTFENCYIQGRLNPAIGAGLGKNGALRLINCTLIGETTRALYLHGYPDSDTPNQAFFAERCIFRNLSGSEDILVDDVNGLYGLTNSELEIRFVDCVGKKIRLRTAEDVYQGYIPKEGSVKLSPYSEGNEFVGANADDIDNSIYTPCTVHTNGLFLLPWPNANKFAITPVTVTDASGADIVDTVSVYNSGLKNGTLFTTTSGSRGTFFVYATVVPV